MKSNEVATVSSSLLCEHLLREYGEPSHHGAELTQAQFEVLDLDGVEQRLLITQRGIGSAATYKIYVHEALNGGFESVYGAKIGTGKITQHVKSKNNVTTLSFDWPESVMSGILYRCIDHRVY